MRLDHIVQSWLRASGCPTTSLKEAQQRVRRGDVTVAGSVSREPKQQVLPGIEEVALRACGTPLSWGDHAFYIMHKPAGVICQRHPVEPSIYSLIPQAIRRRDLGCVGRLDRDTTGALLLCTDGGVQSLLLHPDSRVWKKYNAELSSESTLEPDAVASFAAGLMLSDGTRCAPATLEVHVPHRTGVRMHMHVHMHVHMHTRMHADADAHMHTHMHMHTCMQVLAAHRVSVTLHEGFFHQVSTACTCTCSCTCSCTSDGGREGVSQSVSDGGREGVSHK